MENQDGCFEFRARSASIDNAVIRVQIRGDEVRLTIQGNLGDQSVSGLRRALAISEAVEPRRVRIETGRIKHETARNALNRFQSDLFRRGADVVFLDRTVAFPNVTCFRAPESTPPELEATGS